LTFTQPVRTESAKRSPEARSRVKIAARRPYGDAFVSSIACSSESIAITGATGPNVSSTAIFASALTPSRIVGCQ
jgi:hypothetical protein